MQTKTAYFVVAAILNPTQGDGIEDSLSAQLLPSAVPSDVISETLPTVLAEIPLGPKKSACGSNTVQVDAKVFHSASVGRRNSIF